MSPEVMRPTPPLARSVKYSIILVLGLPDSSAMLTLPMGAMTRRFLSVRRFTRMGENIVS